MTDPKRNYKLEYERDQKHRTAYRAALNKANREAGTYGNGDGKDTAHVKDDPEIHTFDLPEGETEEVALQATYAAIRLTC